ncbi:MAG TPA: glycogen debranching N-terminal domain-containing protein [Gaiellaceae bacterium]|nr:glycogen debranching N-terminal domain-containing protein [Gaiellaceae bacterium]
MAMTILDGSTFCVCDEHGDVEGKASATGFFASDTRFLSRAVLLVDGSRPESLSYVQPVPHVGLFCLRNAPSDNLQPNTLSILRERFVGDEMQERIVVQNHSSRTVDVDVELQLEADFADIFSVKDLDPKFGDPTTATLPPPRAPQWSPGDTTLVFEDDTFPARTCVQLSVAPAAVAERVRFPVRLEPKARWELLVAVLPVLGEAVPPPANELLRRIEQDRARADDSHETWRRSTPRLRSSRDDLVRTWQQSVADLGALRMHIEEFDYGRLPAAGSPWFMTVFGRDTLITCLQTQTFGSALSESALRVLAATQATDDDPERDAEPGKIIHEFRSGKAAAVGFTGDRYYGTLDATPLFLILLSELWRWTGDAQIVRELEGPARRAVAWIDGAGDRDGDGFVEYERRSSHGIFNQSWKDSWDSMVYRDGRICDRAPIAPAEVQGYVYDAKLRFAELEREVWGDADAAVRLERDAAALRERFDQAFWVEDGGYYALGLDPDKRQIDALGSNAGHLLWSGIVPPERAAHIADLMMSDRMWSGWGIRTLAADERGYNPLVYHDGTVWPHDNSLVAAGLARLGRIVDVERILLSIVEAAAHFGYRLPEVFAGFPREEIRFPAAYPTASRPQAWAAATPILLVQLLLGLRPDRRTQTLEAAARNLPDWCEGLRLDGVQAFGRWWSVRVCDGSAVVEEEDVRFASP